MTAQQQQIVQAIELAANVTLAAIPYTAAFAPLAASLEAGINPLIASIGSGNTTTSTIMAAFGAMIAVIGTLKQVPGVSPEVLAKLEEYAKAAQEGLQAALLAGIQGYDASQLTPVAPIA